MLEVLGKVTVSVMGSKQFSSQGAVRSSQVAEVATEPLMRPCDLLPANYCSLYLSDEVSHHPFSVIAIPYRPCPGRQY